jgi:hypothetical protein
VINIEILNKKGRPYFKTTWDLKSSGFSLIARVVSPLIIKQIKESGWA